MSHLNEKRKLKETIKRQLWLVLVTGYPDKGTLEYYRRTQKGFNVIFCTDSKAEALRKLQSLPGDPNVKIVSAKVTRREVR